MDEPDELIRDARNAFQQLERYGAPGPEVSRVLWALADFVDDQAHGRNLDNAVIELRGAVEDL